jgi:uncharacterized surface protein with fasciclin (FAS1) repeats
MKNIITISGILLLTLALTACGAGAPAAQAPGDSAATASTAVLADPTVAAVVNDPVAAADTIVAAAADDPRFTTLVTLLETSGLNSTLAGPGPFTVFAPTNDAFMALPPDMLTTLAQNPALLEDLLLYHVVDGVILSTDIKATTNATTVSGASLNVDASNGVVTINDDAQVVTPDIEVGNGVIHAIDTVLLPPDLVLPSGS